LLIYFFIQKKTVKDSRTFSYSIYPATASVKWIESLKENLAEDSKFNCNYYAWFLEKKTIGNFNTNQVEL